jgi:ABC-type glutathione transport system ATPase component
VAAEAVRDHEGAGDTIVVGRGGWLRLPEEYLRRAGIVTHASARLERDEIVVRAAGDAAQERVPAESAARLSPPPAVVAELRGVSKSYGNRDVLRGLDATFPGGTLTAVTGPSGSGKTTLLHLLAGLELAHTGRRRRRRDRGLGSRPGPPGPSSRGMIAFVARSRDSRRS